MPDRAGARTLGTWKPAPTAPIAETCRRSAIHLHWGPAVATSRRGPFAMPWPLAHDFQDAVLNPRSSFADADLCTADVVKDPHGLPVPASGQFGIVYQMVHPSGRRWAVKCFTRDQPGRGERYEKISTHLRGGGLPFMVGFDFLREGVFIKGAWYPVLKMDWVEGQTLNAFIGERIDQPLPLRILTEMWPKVARALRQAQVTHADLQHGNAML